LIEILQDPETAALEPVIGVLSELGRHSRAAFGTLKALMSDKLLGLKAEMAIARIGPPSAAGVKLLVHLHKKPKLRLQVVRTLGRMGEMARSAIPCLINNLGGSNRGLLKASLMALEQIGVREQGSLAAVIELAKRRKELRGDCLRVFKNLSRGAEAGQTIAYLESYYGDADEKLKMRAIMMLSGLGKDAVPVRVIKPLSLSKDRDVAFSAARVLLHMGQRDPLLLDLLKKSLDSAVHRKKAIGSIRDLGQTALLFLPELVEILELKDEALVLKIVNILPVFGKHCELLLPFLLSDFDSSRFELKKKLIGLFQSLGRQARLALPTLIRAMKEKRLRPELRASIEAIGLEADLAVPALIPLLDDKDQELSRFAKSSLYSFGPQTLPALTRALNKAGASEELRAAALMICAEFSVAELRKELPRFIDALFYSGVDVQKALAKVFIKIGPPATRRLCHNLKQSYWRRRKNAAFALGEIGPAAKSAASHLMTASNDSSGAVRNAAIDSLVKIGPALGADILKELKSCSESRQCQLLTVFTRWGERSKAYIPNLAALIRKDSYEDTVVGVLRCFESFKTRHEAIERALVGALDDDRSRVLLAALEILSRSGAVHGSVPRVTALLESKDGAVRVAAVRNLTAPAKGALALYPRFIAGLGDADKAFRKACLRALASHGRAHKAVPLAVLKELKNKSWLVRAYAARCLGQMGPAGAVAVDQLRKTIADKDARVRWASALALGGIGAKAQAGTKELTLALLDEDEDVVLVAIVALGKIGPKARSAAPALKKLKRIANAEQKEAIDKSLKAIEKPR
jgi:HEAT repeat protein